jgi:hypothetical protein
VRYYRAKFGCAFGGDDKKLKRALELASAWIDRVTLGRARARLTEFQTSRVRDACCRQADWLDENGADGESISGYSLGDLSVSLAKGGRGGFSRAAWVLLEGAGLLTGEV